MSVIRPSIFITGSTGYIGKHLLTELSRENAARLICLCRNPDPKHSPAGATFVRGDLCEPDTYRSFLADCDTVIHLAALTGRGSRAEFLRINHEGTRKLIEACSESGVKRFLYVSTVAVKFKNKQAYPYAESKELAEQEVMKAALRYSIVRPTIVLGKNSVLWEKLSGLVHRSMIFLPGGGRTRIQPVHVHDLVRCFMRTFHQDLFTREIFEIGGAEAVTFERFFKMIHTIRYGDPTPLLVKLPVRPAISILKLLENAFGNILPVGAGQLSAFCNDGTVQPNHLYDACRSDMMPLEVLLKDLISND